MSKPQTVQTQPQALGSRSVSAVPRPLPARPDDPNLREEGGRDWSRLYGTFLEVGETKGAKNHTEPPQKRL